jgi:hypothetical protein
MPVAPDLAGSALDGRYELHRLIGEGTFGRVYRGRDRRLRREVAIKVIKPWWADDPAWSERFEREAQLLARLSHPNIVQIYDVGQSEEGLWYVAELVEGESLAARVRRGPLAPDGAADIAAQLCAALAHMHAGQLIHRDIKPANVLLDGRGRVKLGDFSLARLGGGSSDGAPTLAGTPRYMAPEQARGRPATAATDLYSVGVVLYEMLAGRPPFGGGTPVELALRHLAEPPAPLPASVPPGLAAVVMRALAKDPRERYASAAAMASALRAARRGAAPAVAAEAPPRFGPDGTHVAAGLGPRRNLNPPARRRAIALVAAVAGLAALMLAVALVLGAGARVRVPPLRGLPRAAAQARLGRAHLRALFARRYDGAAAGTVIAQAPPAGRRAQEGSVVRVTVSAGPPPVRLPPLRGRSQTAAIAALRALGLQPGVRTVPAPGTAAGTVTGQAPAAGISVAAHSNVTLDVAEVPRWRTVTSFTGTDSGPIRIRGARWRIVYRMSYVGTCTFIFFCDGPTAHVNGTSFGLSDGGGRTREFDTGPGTYDITLTPGADTASWVIEVQDNY